MYNIESAPCLFFTVQHSRFWLKDIYYIPSYWHRFTEVNGAHFKGLRGLTVIEEKDEGKYVELPRVQNLTSNSVWSKKKIIIVVLLLFRCLHDCYFYQLYTSYITLSKQLFERPPEPLEKRNFSLSEVCVLHLRPDSWINYSPRVMWVEGSNWGTT